MTKGNSLELHDLELGNKKIGDQSENNNSRQ
jgi:hypothetical protein